MIVLLNKPYGVLSQFTDSSGRPTLSDFIPIKDIYPAGRLDFDSEGLILLTNEGKLQHSLTDPQIGKPKTYWAQDEGRPTEEAIEQLKEGVIINKKKTRGAKVRIIPEPNIWDRTPPIRQRKSIPTSWVKITITEGRNRQVRKMTAAVGYPTLRLIRVSIGEYSIGELLPGKWKTI